MSILYRRLRGAVNLREKLPDVKQRPLLTTVRATDAGKAAAGIAAVEIPLHDLLDDRPEKTALMEAMSTGNRTSRSKRTSYSVRNLSK